MALFGTDGVRGVANTELSSEMALAIGKAAGSIWGASARVMIGRDTRVSSSMLESAVAAGLSALGVEVWLTGMLPTPALAYLIKAYDCTGGVMISASHNPPEHNGIKLLDGDGRKWAPADEALVEGRMQHSSQLGVLAAQIGLIRHHEADVIARYHAHLHDIFARRIDALHVVVDLAHGAAIATAVPVLQGLGLKVTAINAEPDGEWINHECGATHPRPLQDAVLQNHAALGLAFDGDADRLIAVDHRGQIVDGDGILYALGRGLHEQGHLRGDLVVATVMSNLGLERALEASGIGLLRTPVGDRWVAEMMRERDSVLGGEQSGHIILQEWAETGDGLLTGLALMAEMTRAKRSLADLVAPVERYPQILKNLRLEVPLAGWQAIPGLVDAVAKAERDLGHEGRVLIRPSGTEPLLRIMVEGRDQSQIEAWTEALVSTVQVALAQA